jgi:hypothetical protein
MYDSIVKNLWIVFAIVFAFLSFCVFAFGSGQTKDADFSRLLTSDFVISALLGLSGFGLLEFLRVSRTRCNYRWLRRNFFIACLIVFGFTTYLVGVQFVVRWVTN